MLVQFCFPFLVQSQAHEMVPPTLRVGLLPTSINSIKKIPHSRPRNHANLDIALLRLVR